jgi:cytoskeleton protein RodZ
MSATAETLGQRLKGERERRGMSVQKAADDMHLDAWVIEALETGEYARIGPSVYAKGHLKHYASLLGLPAEEILAGYDAKTSAPSPAAQPGSSVRMRTSEPMGSELPWLQMAGFAILAVIIAGVIWWRPWHPRTAVPAAVAVANPQPNAVAGTAQDMPPTEAAGFAAPDAATAPDAGVPDAPAAKGAAFGRGAGGATGAAAPATSTATVRVPVTLATSTAGADTDTEGYGRARLRLSFSADSWVDVHDAAGRRVFAGSGRANSVKTIAGTAPMRVYLGFASGVQLEVNNRAVAIGRQFVAGDVARFEAGADGVLRRDVHGAATPGVATPGVTTRDAAPADSAPTATRSAHPHG